MHVGVKTAAAVLVMIGVGAPSVNAAEATTWYVYCEGASPEGHWAVFSESFWSHPETEDYGRHVGSAAKAFFETRHDVSLDGCSGVNFRTDVLAEHSRKMTALLHRNMGDRVYFFSLPTEVLPQDAPAEKPVAAVTASVDEREASAVGTGETDQNWEPFTAPR